MVSPGPLIVIDQTDETRAQNRSEQELYLGESHWVREPLQDRPAQIARYTRDYIPY